MSSSESEYDGENELRKVNGDGGKRKTAETNGAKKAASSSADDHAKKAKTSDAIDRKDPAASGHPPAGAQGPVPVISASGGISTNLKDAKKANNNNNNDDSSSSDDDDKPLSALVKPKAKPAAAAAKGGAKTPSKSPAAAAKSSGGGSASASKKKESAASASSSAPQRRVGGGDTRDEMISDILCRWWYVPELQWPGVDWPEAAESMPDRPAAEWTPMAAFPWMFQNAVGSVLNLRNTPERMPPSYNKLNTFTDSELRRVLAIAYRNQLHELPENQAPNLRRLLQDRIAYLAGGRK